MRIQIEQRPRTVVRWKTNERQQEIEGGKSWVGDRTGVCLLCKHGTFMLLAITSPDTAVYHSIAVAQLKQPSTSQRRATVGFRVQS